MLRAVALLAVIAISVAVWPVGLVLAALFGLRALARGRW